MPNFAVLEGESRHDSSAETTTSNHVRVRHPWETCSFTSFSESVSALNNQIFTYFVQRRSFLSSCYHFNLKQAFEWQTEEFGSYDYVPRSLSLVACSLSSQRSRMLMQKRPLLIPSGSNILQYKNRVFLTGNQRFVYKSKMATKRRVWVANLKFDLQSESYCSILAIMHFCDAFYLKIKIIQVSFVPLNWAIQPPQLMDYLLLINFA